MNPILIVLICLSIAVVPYLLGSIDFAIVVCKIVAGEDIRKYGSGNAGLTNVLRVFGKGPALATLIGDFSKAILGVLFARLMLSLWIPTALFDGAYVGGLFVLLGHIFPVYYHFKGGKGVLTCAGIALVVNPLAFLIGMTCFVIIVLITRYVSLGSIVSIVVFAVSVGLLNFINQRPVWFEFGLAAVFAAIVVFMHRSNIKRLLAGTENKLSFSSKK